MSDQLSSATGSSGRLSLKIVGIESEAQDIKSFRLQDPGGAALPAFTAGAHVDVFIKDGLIRQYSLCSDPADLQSYQIAVLRETDGKGGSQAMHEELAVGQEVEISIPRNNFPLAEDAGKHIFLAGGIGVTPMMAMVKSLSAAGKAFDLHYCTKTEAHTAFRDHLRDLAEPGRVIFHHDGGDPSKGLDIAALLRNVEDGAHVYYCGPTGFMAAAEAASSHWPKEQVHFEYFVNEELESDDAEVDGFQLELAASGKSLVVPPEKSIVQVLWENGIDVETSCESGLCGTCITKYLEGEVDHKDMVLDDDEREEFLTVCCSRAKSKRLVLDL